MGYTDSALTLSEVHRLFVANCKCDLSFVAHPARGNAITECAQPSVMAKEEWDFPVKPPFYPASYPRGGGVAPPLLKEN